MKKSTTGASRFKTAKSKRTKKTAYDFLKPWIGSIRSNGKFDSRNAGDQMTDILEEQYRSRRAD